MKNYFAQNLNLAELEAKMPFSEKPKFHKIWTLWLIPEIESQTSLNIELCIKNYLARSLKICGS